MRRRPYDGRERLIVQTELLKLQASGQFPDESAKLKRLTNSQWRWPVVLTTTGIQEIP